MAFFLDRGLVVQRVSFVWRTASSGSLWKCPNEHFALLFRTPHTRDRRFDLAGSAFDFDRLSAADRRRSFASVRKMTSEWPCAFFLSDCKGMLDVKDTVLRRELASIALATRKTKNFFRGMLSAFRAGVSVVVGFHKPCCLLIMLSSVSVAWSDILSSKRRSH